MNKQEELTHRKTLLGASEIIDRLWVGRFIPAKMSSCSANGRQMQDAGFDVYVPCAAEYQGIFDKRSCHHLQVIPCPLHDNYCTVSRAEKLLLIHDVVDKIVNLHRAGKQILVCCAEGRNRSALVAALVVKRLKAVSGEEAVARLREQRNPYFWNRSTSAWGFPSNQSPYNYVLTNETFEEYVKTEQPVSPDKFSDRG